MKQAKIYVGFSALAFFMQVHPMYTKIDFTELTLEELRKVDTKRLSCEGMDDYNLAYEKLLSEQPTAPNSPPTPIPSFTNVTVTSDECVITAPSPRKVPSNPDLSEQVDVAHAFAKKVAERNQTHSAPATAPSSPSLSASHTIHPQTQIPRHSSPVSSAITSSTNARLASPDHDLPFMDAQDLSDMQPVNNLRDSSPFRAIKPSENPGYPPAYTEGSEIKSRPMNYDGTNPSPRGVQLPESQWKTEQDKPGEFEPESKMLSVFEVAGIALAIWTTTEAIMAYKNISEDEWNTLKTMPQKLRLLTRVTGSAMYSRPGQVIGKARELLKSMVAEK